MSEPISLRALRVDVDALRHFASIPVERATLLALVEAVEAVGKLQLCPICQQWVRYADSSPWESHMANCPMARFSCDTEEGT